jgi:hypothetical protein
MDGKRERERRKQHRIDGKPGRERRWDGNGRMGDQREPGRTNK